MDNSRLKERLEMRKVNIEDLEQFNELLRYVFQVTSQSLAQIGYSDDELVKAKYPILEKANVFGWFDEEGYLISQICILPSQVNIHGKLYQMGGVTGVGTYPEYANLGLMNDLIKKALQEMKDNKQWISYLFPYSIPYYRKKGWEIISDKVSYTILDIQLPDSVEVSGIVSREEVNHEDVNDVYNRYALVNHGALIRNKIEWEEYWRWEDEEDRTAAIYYDENDIAQGYLLYWIDEDIMHVKDMIYLTLEARKGLWNFINAHFSMIDKVMGEIFRNETIAFHMKDPTIEEKIEPYYMARIVDVENFLKNYSFNKVTKPFHFVVKDSLVEDNNDVFAITLDENNEVVIKREAIGPEINISIQCLTSMLMSYRLPEYYYRFNYLECDKETLELLSDAIYNTPPYFSDYF